MLVADVAQQRTIIEGGEISGPDVGYESLPNWVHFTASLTIPWLHNRLMGYRSETDKRVLDRISRLRWRLRFLFVEPPAYYDGSFF